MRPEVHIKDDLDRTVERTSYLNPQEQKFLTLYRELSESDKGYLMRVAEVMALVKAPSLK
jgi:hypothetical protein